MPKCAFVAIPREEQAQTLFTRRRTRYDSRLALQILVWWAAKRTPTDMAAVLFCSSSSVYRTVQADRIDTRGLEHEGPG